MTNLFRKRAFVCIAFVALGCEPEPTQAPAPSTNNTQADDRKEPVQKPEPPPEQVAIPAPQPEPQFTRPIKVGVPLAELQKREPIGTISGEIFGDNQPVLAVSRVGCGDGTVLQAVFKSKKGIRVTPPMPTQFFGLATKKPVTYREGEFDVTVNFAEDSPEKLAGSLTIEYKENGAQKTFAKLEVDGPPEAQLYEPKLQGSGKLPKYDGCVPTGYFELKAKGHPAVYGLVHTTNVGGLGVPKIRVPLTEGEGFEAIVIPLEKGATLQDAKVKMRSSRKKGQNPAVIKMEAYLRSEITSPEEATNFNLGRVAVEGVYAGDAVVSLTKQSVELHVTGFELGGALEYSWSGLEIESLRISSGLADENAMRFKLPSAPSWWRETKTQDAPQ